MCRRPRRPATPVELTLAVVGVIALLLTVAFGDRAPVRLAGWLVFDAVMLAGIVLRRRRS